MSTLDIRKDEKVDRIIFDGYGCDLVIGLGNSLTLADEDDCEVLLCSWSDFDNFIKACHEARELWGPKQ